MLISRSAGQFIVVGLMLSVPVLAQQDQPAVSRAPLAQHSPGAPAAAPADSPPIIMKVVALKSLDAEAAADLVKSVTPMCSVGFDRGTNSLVINGPATAVDACLEALGRIDTQAAGQERTRSALIRVGQNVSPDLPSLIKTLISPGTDFAFDRQSGLLVLRGPAEGISEVERLIAEVQKGADPAAAGEALQIELFYVEAGPEGKALAVSAAPGSGTAAGVSGPVTPASAATPESAAVLKKPVRAEFVDVPFVDVAHELGRLAGRDVLVDWADLESQGIERDVPVALVLAGEHPLRLVLEEVLRQVGGPVPLGFSMDGGVVRIASRSRMGGDGVLVTYDVTDLSEQVRVDLVQAIESTINPESWRGSGGAMAEIRLVGIDPESWREKGGTVGEIRLVGGLCLVMQSPEVQESVAALIERVRAVESRAAAAESGPLPPVLAPVCAVLAEQGLGRMTLLGTQTVRASTEGKFMASGTAERGGDLLRLEGQGRVRRSASGKAADLEFSASVERVGRPARDAASSVRQLFSVETTAAVPLGDYIVLAASPAASDQTRTISLIVRVTAVH